MAFPVTNQRNHTVPSSSAVCQLEVNFCFVHGNIESKKIARRKLPVKILRFNWNHTCSCSAKIQTVGRKVSGFYQRNILDRKLESFLELTDKNVISTNVFLKLMTKMGYKGGIQSIGIAHLRNEGIAVKIIWKKLTINDVTQWIDWPGLVEDFPHVILNGYVAVIQAK